MDVGVGGLVGLVCLGVLGNEGDKLCWFFGGMPFN